MTKPDWEELKDLINLAIKVHLASGMIHDSKLHFALTDDIMYQVSLLSSRKELDSGKILQCLQEAHPHPVNQVLADAILTAYDKGELE